MKKNILKVTLRLRMQKKKAKNEESAEEEEEKPKPKRAVGIFFPWRFCALSKAHNTLPHDSSQRRGAKKVESDSE